MYSQKFWENLALGILLILAISLGFGLVRGTVDITQVALSLIALIGVIRGASLKEIVKPKTEEAPPPIEDDEKNGS